MGANLTKHCGTERWKTNRTFCKKVRSYRGGPFVIAPAQLPTPGMTGVFFHKFWVNSTGRLLSTTGAQNGIHILKCLFCVAHTITQGIKTENEKSVT